MISRADLLVPGLLQTIFSKQGGGAGGGKKQKLFERGGKGTP